jgi:hypothetical protein
MKAYPVIARAKAAAFAPLMFALGGCGPEHPTTSEFRAPSDDGPIREPSNECGSAVERDLATLAMFIAEEMHRWDVGRDLEIENSTGSVRLSATGEARCTEGCPKTRSLLALQQAVIGDGNTVPRGFGAALGAGWRAQSEMDGAPPAVEDHELSRIGKEPGGCGMMYWYDAQRAKCTDDCLYADTEALARRLTFAGYPTNRYLHFQTATDRFGRSGSLVGLDPDDGEGTGFDPNPLDGACRRIEAGRYLDAYTGGDGDVVTRPFQDDTTQRWCFTRVGTNIYTIQHRTFAGQFLDAFQTSNGHKAVLRDAQSNDSQRWETYDYAGVAAYVPITQVSTGRRLTYLNSSADDYRAVTASSSNTGWMFWAH